MDEEQKHIELKIDFLSPAMKMLRRSARSAKQPLAKAIGLKSGTQTIIDATAGLGKDAFLMTCMGCHVLALERVEPVFRVLDEAHSRACEDLEIGDMVFSRLRIVLANSIEYLKTLKEDDYPDVVYVDPMYPVRKKSALSKKEMRIFRSLVGDDSDSNELVAIALKRAKRRVVVKRPLRAEPLYSGVGQAYEGKMVRYDAYFIRSTQELLQGQ